MDLLNYEGRVLAALHSEQNRTVSTIALAADLDEATVDATIDYLLDAHAIDLDEEDDRFITLLWPATAAVAASLQALARIDGGA
jgi:DNA-binding transcriptional ArsR family regulator